MKDPRIKSTAPRTGPGPCRACRITARPRAACASDRTTPGTSPRPATTTLVLRPRTPVPGLSGKSGVLLDLLARAEADPNVTVIY